MDTDKENRQDRLVQQAIAGDRCAFAQLFEENRPRLRKMIDLRMAAGLRGRYDASDVLQEAFIEAAKQLPDYAAQQKIPFFIWLRLVTGQRLAKLHRKHLGTAKRDANREVSLLSYQATEASAYQMASFFAASFTSPTAHLRRDELRTRVQMVLDDMPPQDREVLALRHFEELSIRESALVLEISETAASSRYRRAIIRVTEAFKQVPGLLPDEAQNDDYSSGIVANE